MEHNSSSNPLNVKKNKGALILNFPFYFLNENNYLCKLELNDTLDNETI